MEVPGGQGVQVGHGSVQHNTFIASAPDPGTLGYRRRDEPSSLPVRLGPRPAVLAGREGLLADLDARLASTGAQPGRRVVVLCGLGGAGKTSVAVEYAHRHMAGVGVCWQFAAEDPAELGAQFAELAAQLGARELADIRDPVASVHGVLARAETGWLVVFDNVTDLASVERFLPPAGDGRVLVTTQSQHWPHGWAVEVPVLDTEVAAGFLVSRTGDADRAAARELADALGGLPLALEQAAAYMRASGTSLGRYLPLFRVRQVDLLARGEAAGHPLNVAAALGLGMSRLAGEAPGAVAVLRLLAFLAPEPVPLPALLGDGPVADPAVAATVGSLPGDMVAVGDAVAALRRYSLVAPAGDGLVLVHRLVQAVTRAQIPAGQAAQWKQAAAVLVEAAVPADAQLPASWTACALLLPHAQAVLDPAAPGMHQIAGALGNSGSYPAARDLAQQIAAARERDEDYGPEHPDTLSVRSHLASWTGAAGDAAGARDQHAALLPVMERVLGPEHPSTLVARRDVAYLTWITGDAAGARGQSAALLPVMERILGPEDFYTLSVRSHLADWTGAAGDAAGARDQYAALLPIAERVFGPEHPTTLEVRRDGLAHWTGAAGDAAGARDQHAALLPVMERVFGPEHPSTLSACDDLARWTGAVKDAGRPGPKVELNA